MGISAHFFGGRHSLVCILFGFATFISLAFSGLVQSDFYIHMRMCLHSSRKRGGNFRTHQALEKKQKYTNRPANAVAATAATAATSNNVAFFETQQIELVNARNTHTHTRTHASYPYTLAS